MTLSSIGLLLVAIAWLVQLYFLLKGRKEIQRSFVIVYMAGVFLLVMNGAMSGGIMTAKFELCTLITSAIVMMKLLVGK